MAAAGLKCAAFVRLNGTNLKIVLTMKPPKQSFSKRKRRAGNGASIANSWSNWNKVATT